MTGPTRAPATLAADLAALSEQATPGLLGSFGMTLLASPTGGGDVTLATPVAHGRTIDENGRPRTWDIDYIEALWNAHRAGHLVTLDAALDWVAEQLADPEVQREAYAHEIRQFVAGGRGPDELRHHYRDGLLAALRDRAASPAPQPDTTHDTKEQP